MPAFHPRGPWARASPPARSCRAAPDRHSRAARVSRPWASCAAGTRRCPACAPHNRRAAGTESKRAISVCRSLHPGPSPPGHGRRGARQASVDRPTPGSGVWPRARASRWHPAGPLPVPHCRRRQRHGSERQCSQSPPPYKARCRAGSAGRSRIPGTARHGPPPRPARISTGSWHAHSIQDRPRPPSHRYPRLRQGRAPWAKAS